MARASRLFNRAEEYDHAGVQANALEQGKARRANTPLRPKHVWSIRAKVQIDGRARDLAMFKLQSIASSVAVMSLPYG
jgi:hypothetical protein